MLPLGAACASPGITCASTVVLSSSSNQSESQPSAADVPTTTAHTGSRRQKREADDAYLEGAKFFARGEFQKAQRQFERAVHLDPDNRTYVLALLYAREVEVKRLMQASFKSRLAGDAGEADRLFAGARTLDPNNPLVLQFADTLRKTTGQQERRTSEEFEGPLALTPFDGVRSFHTSGATQQVVREVYRAFGIESVFDPSVLSGKNLRIDVDDVDFLGAARVLHKAAHLFAVPLDSTSALIADDAEEVRGLLMPLVEETIYLSSQNRPQMLELANVLRSHFDLTHLAVNADSGIIVVRGPQASVHRIHDLLTELAVRTADILLDINIYEVDKTTARKIGFAPPTSATATDVSGTAQKLISDNQTLLNESISSGALTLSGTTYQQELQEVAFLVAAGVSGSSSLTSILGTVGSLEGVPLLGISMGSTSLNMLLNSTDVRMLNALQIRSSDRHEATLRVGSRYPILTAITTSASSSTVAQELAAAGVSSSVIAQLTGSSGSGSNTTPQIQFEDIGLTLKLTPRLLRDGDVELNLDFKLESLGGTGVNDIPILNNRALKSTVTIAPGQSTMLAALVSTDEAKALDGLPGMADLPGFQSTNKNSDGTRNELLITVTPHVVSDSAMHVSTYRVGDRF